MIILVENHRIFLISEHGPSLRGCKRDVEYGRPPGREAEPQEAMLRLGPHSQKMTDLADLVMFSIHEEQARARQGCQEIRPRQNILK